MRYAVLGTGVVGQTIATKLASLGHEVSIGSRSRENEAAAKWAQETGGNARHGSFADAAEFGEVVFNCTAGVVSVAAVRQAGVARFAGKILIDVANRLEMTPDGPRTVLAELSLAEQLQQALPEARVVKTLNTVNHQLMVEPGLLAEPHDIFMAGDDPGAKAHVAELLQSFGWPRGSILDLGDISAARGMELYMPLWIRLWQATRAPHFNVKVVRSGGSH